jgi:transcriptional regulator with XRE-family HTH domain
MNKRKSGSTQVSSVGRRLKRLRREKGLTLKELEGLSGVDRVYMSEVERGVTWPTVSALDKLSRALKKNLLFFLEDIEESTRRIVLSRTTQERGAAEGITLDALEGELLPYLRAIQTIQNVADEIDAKVTRPLSLYRFEKYSPITIDIRGAAQAIELLLSVVVPWRREHSERMATYREKERVLEIRSLEIAVTQQQEQAATQAERGQKELEKLALELKALTVALRHSQIDLAGRILTDIKPNMSEPEYARHLHQLIPGIEVLTESCLEPSRPET